MLWAGGALVSVTVLAAPIASDLYDEDEDEESVSKRHRASSVSPTDRHVGEVISDHEEADDYDYTAHPAPEPIPFFTLSPGGLVQVDAAQFDNDRGAYQGNAIFRRLRLSVEGEIGAAWAYDVEADFSNDTARFTDALIAYRAVPRWEFTFGQFKEPFSLEFVSSNRRSLFIERATVNTLVPGRYVGAMATHYGTDWAISAGAFGPTLGRQEDDDQKSVAARATYAPWHAKGDVLHLGLAGSVRDPDTLRGDALRLSARPETRVTPLRAVDTGRIADVDSVALLGVEAALHRGPWLMQAEWVRSSLDRDAARPNVAFDGGYIALAAMLTGETRSYNVAKGTFGGIKPRRPLTWKNGELSGAGAWEVAGRLSVLDLNDDVVRGGQLRSATLGVNWYVNDAARLMFNYSWLRSDADAVFANDTPQVMALRAQWTF